MDFSSLNVDAVLELSDCGRSFNPIELYDNEHISRGLSKAQVQNAPLTASTFNDLIHDAPAWLPFASEKYQISADIHDYVMVPVIIAPTDLPNRNMVAFPYLELSSFLPQVGQISYQTWKGKPTYVEHINNDYTKSKGIVLDASLQPMHGRAGNLWKVVCLCGFDRSKDAALANDILTGTRPNYSMGAMVSTYSCSICGAESVAGKGKELPCGTNHINPKSGRFMTFDTAQGRIIGHYNAHNIQGFEVSSVKVPAWPSANAGTDLHLSY